MSSPLLTPSEHDLLPIFSTVDDPLHARSKILNDPVHAHFTLPPALVSVLDTPHVQRLRDLKQLGGTYLVYPGASHNRFEHSLGVAHLSRHYLSVLRQNHKRLRQPLFENDAAFESAAQLVEIAGLCHDLGHGPFSHMFDYAFLPAVSSKLSVERHHPLLEHEARSVKLFEHLVDTYHLDISQQQIRHISALILAEKYSANSTLTPSFLYDIVANCDTGIDTDKFDYIARDIYNLGLRGAYGFDHMRLIQFARVINSSICFHRKEIFNVYHMFLTRFHLHRTVYNHPAALSIDAMITDAFLAADSTLHIADSIADCQKFLGMTDCLIPIIERSTDSSLKEARDIVHRLRTRKLYRLVREVLVPFTRSAPHISEEKLVECQDQARTGVILKSDDVHVVKVRLNFGSKKHGKNPVDQVLFFKHWQDSSPVHIPSQKVSYVFPPTHEETLIRVFIKPEVDENHRIRNAINVALTNFMKLHGLEQSLSSPIFQNPHQKSPPRIAEVKLTSSVSAPDDRLRKRGRADIG